MTTRKPPTARETLRAKGYLPAGEVAERLGYTRQAIYDWAKAGKVHEVRMGAARWVEWTSVVAYLKEKNPEIVKLLNLEG